MTAGTTYFDLGRFRATAPIPSPYPHLVMENFLRPEHQAAIDRDFPAIRQGGSYDLSTLAPGPAMIAAIEELRGEAMTTAVAEKFGVDLRGRPTTVTLRGRCRARDGRIHADSRDKLVTLLIYLNPGWSERTGGGCLRMLRSASDIDDHETEVPARMGTLVAFPCLPNAWHGHRPFEGRRRSIQLNWVTDTAAAERSRSRHRWSALWKKLNPLTTGGPFRRVRPTASAVGGGKAGGTPALPGRVRPTASSIGGEGDPGPGIVPSTFQPAEVESSPDR